MTKPEKQFNGDMDCGSKDWKFRVKADVLPGECVCVVGNCSQLGGWKPNRAVLLAREAGVDEEQKIWSCIASIPADEDVEYRYFIAVLVDSLSESEGSLKSNFVVRRWETHLIPRMIPKNAVTNIDELSTLDEDIFGLHNQNKMVDRGWLTTDTAIQLKLFNNPVEFWKRRYVGKKINMKVTPIKLSSNSQVDTVSVDNIDESLDTLESPSLDLWPLAEIAVMNRDDCKYKLQEQFGRPYNENDFIIFNITVHHPELVAYLVDFYVYKSVVTEDELPVHVGYGYILPSVLTKSEGQAIVPITNDKHQPIGQLTVEYVVIQPIQGYECDMSVSYSRLWKKSWEGLDVGHRGLGTSFKHEVQSCADIRENTIASLKRAASHGADFVEFDVQLTKDLIPVLYHDFHVCIAMKRKKQLEDHDMLELPVKDLTLEQLRLLKVYHLEEGKSKNPRFFDEDLEEHQPFPTLQQALETLDPHVGFNVEIKWTMKLKDGSYELYHPFDLNLYLDVVVKVVLQYAGHRKIVFSCFHPDICTMIRLKQNKYPVMFLTQGITCKYPPYHDTRTQSIPMAIFYALSAEILGINVHTEDLLRDPSQVKLVRDAGLVIFCWGEDNNDSSTLSHLKSLGLHAVIYDKIDKFGTKEVKESIFLVEAREAQNNLLRVAHDVEKQMSTPDFFLGSQQSTLLPKLPETNCETGTQNTEYML